MGVIDGNIKNKNEFLIRRQLEQMEILFSKLAKSFEKAVIETEDWKLTELEEILREAEGQYCGDCARLDLCHNKKKQALLATGIITEDDVVSFLTCRSGQAMIDAVNGRYQQHMYQMRLQKQMQIHQKFFVEQFQMAAGLIEQYKEQWNCEKPCETKHEALIKAAKTFGVEMKKVMLSSDRPEHVMKINVLLRSKKGERTAKEIAGILSTFLHRKIKPQPRCKTIVGNTPVWMEFIEDTRFYVLMGSGRKPCQDQIFCGEQFSMETTENGTFAAIICDGLGTGEVPGKESKRVIELLENLLESGIPVDTAVNMVRASMCFSPYHERYVTLDCVFLDLYTGIGKLVKLGSAETFVIRKDQVEIISGTYPPVGVVTEEKDFFLRKKIESGDKIIMVSDGVVDEFGDSKRFADFLQGVKENCPQLICDRITDQLQEQRDDCTVLAFGVWSK